MNIFLERRITMIHQMRLYSNAFLAMKNGKKTIEMRLFDEKRKILQVGDYIEFMNTETKEVLHFRIKNLYKYDNFEQLYLHHHPISLGYQEDEIANPKDMLAYYSDDKIKKYGVLAIEIENLTAKDTLLANIEKIHTTPMGIERIKKNLHLNQEDVISYCKEKIQCASCQVQKVGKNFYCSIQKMIFTIHAQKFTIITAHLKEGQK